jgi:hypothetical protein
MKYDLIYNYTGNVVVDTTVYVNNAVSGLLVYGIILAFFIIITYVFITRTDDVPLSLVRSLFATVIVSIITYYMGKNYGLNLFSGSFLITMILVLVFSIGALYYNRNQAH